MVLAFGSIFWGFLSKDMVIGFGSPFFSNSLMISFENLIVVDAEFAAVLLKNIPFIFSLLGILISYLLINCSFTIKKVVFSFKVGYLYRLFYTFLSKKWHFDQIANEIFSNQMMNFGYNVSFQTIDKGNIEKFGALGSSVKLMQLSKKISILNTGFFFHYAFIMVSTLLLFFTVLFFAFSTVNLNLIFILLVLSYFILCLFL